MAKRTKPKFETEDGREFDTREAAERHERVAAATEKYNDARREFGRALAETQKTADGKRFSFDQSCYWYVTDGIFNIPTIVEVRYLGSNLEFDDSDEFTIIDKLYQSDGHVSRNEYKISKLYATEAAAKKAYVDAIEKWATECRKHADELITAAKVEKT